MNALPHDPALPQLAQALDGNAMAPVFAAALRGPQLRACSVERIKYRPRRNVSVSYRLQLHDATQGDFEQLVAARFCSGGDSARRHEQAGHDSWQPSAAGPALQHVPALDMLAFWLPNDPKLAALRRFGDAAALRASGLDDVVAALSGGRGQWLAHRATVVQLVPESRACARVELQMQPAPGAAATAHTLYVKARVDRGGADTHRRMQALSDSSAQRDGSLFTPRSLHWHAGAGLHWLAALPGRTLLDADAAVGPASSARVGRQLAALHATAITASAAAIDAAALRARHAHAAQLLGSVEPRWQPLLTRLVAQLDAGAEAVAASALATLHGDLHPNNILVAERSGVTHHAFIDLDDLHSGPAALEVGGWVADAMARALLAGRAPGASVPANGAFLSAYHDAGGRPIDDGLLAWGAAHQLLCRRAYGGVANLKPGRFASVPALLALADTIARAGTLDAMYDCAQEAA